MHLASRALWGVPSLGIAIAVSTGCVRTPSGVGTALADKCPGHSRVVTRENDTFPVPLAGQIVDLPEFHDCQRFLPKSGDDFGALAAIWAAQNLAEAFDRVPPPAAGAPVVMVAVAVTHIWNGAYPPLGMQPAFNCLYLGRTTASPTGWVGMMVPLGPTAERCLGTRTDLGGVPLPVRPVPRPDSLLVADVPAVARWDRTMQAADTNRGLHYIGIRCATEWCEVGPYPERPAHNDIVRTTSGKDLRDRMKPAQGVTPSMSNREAGRVRDIKGWHDEQTLAKPGGKTSSQVSGAAFPQPELDRIEDEGSFRERWIPSAYILLDRPYAGNPLNLPRGHTTVELCRGSSVACTGATAARCKHALPSPGALNQWWARISSENGDTFYRCVRRHEHTMASGSSGVIPEGAVRWAWSDDDESLWIRCADGCCTID